MDYYRLWLGVGWLPMLPSPPLRSVPMGSGMTDVERPAAVSTSVNLQQGRTRWMFQPLSDQLIQGLFRILIGEVADLPGDGTPQQRRHVTTARPVGASPAER